MMRPAALLLVLVLLLAGPVAGAESIRVGYLGPLTGIFAAAGKDMLDGLKLAFEQVNYEVAGRKIELIEEDDEGNPATAQAKYRKLVSQDRIHVLDGVLLSNIGYALVPNIERDRLPSLFLTTPDEITKRKSAKYVIRSNFAASQPMHALGDYAARTLKYRRVAAIAMDNNFGHEGIGGFQRVFEDAGGRVVQKTWAPLNTMDFAPYLTQVPRDVDAVVQVFVAGQAVRFAKQYGESALAGKVPLIGTGVFTDQSSLQGMGDEVIGHVGALIWAPKGQAHAVVLPRRHVQLRPVDPRGRARARRQRRGPRPLPGRAAPGERDDRGSARADQARRVQQPHGERLHRARREDRRTTAEHRDPHVSHGVAVLDVPAGGVPQDACVRSHVPARQAVR